MKGKERNRWHGERQPDWAAFRGALAEEMRVLGVPAEEAEAEARVMEGRMRMRLAWTRERFAEFMAMQDKACDAYARAMDERPDVDWDAEDAPELPPPPEEALAEAILAEVRAALEGEKWPRHLHFHGV
jgi:hypothetical protein